MGCKGGRDCSFLLIPEWEISVFVCRKVVTAAEALSSALASTEQLAGHESTSSLQLLADQRAKLMGLTEV